MLKHERVEYLHEMPSSRFCNRVSWMIDMHPSMRYEASNTQQIQSKLYVIVNWNNYVPLRHHRKIYFQISKFFCIQLSINCRSRRWRQTEREENATKCPDANLFERLLAVTDNIRVWHTAHRRSHLGRQNFLKRCEYDLKKSVFWCNSEFEFVIYRIQYGSDYVVYSSFCGRSFLMCGSSKCLFSRTTFSSTSDRMWIEIHHIFRFQKAQHNLRATTE